jgi:hypothetical protein
VRPVRATVECLYSGKTLAREDARDRHLKPYPKSGNAQAKAAGPKPALKPPKRKAPIEDALIAWII